MSTDGCQPHESVILGLGIGSTLVLKIGAECSNPARSDLCGGPGETSVPTATFSGALRVFVAIDPCDIGKGFNGLHALVTERLAEDPRGGSLFVFTNR